MIDKFQDYLEVIAIIVFLLAGWYWLQQEFGSETEVRTGEPGLQLRQNRVAICPGSGAGKQETQYEAPFRRLCESDRDGLRRNKW